MLAFYYAVDSYESNICDGLVQYVHSIGLIYCDLRPKNILIDEHGILKLSDFKFARKIPKQTLGDSLLESRGTPPYMAPELFSSEGVHSMASDFWALGCVLYELRRGIAPFGDMNASVSDIIEKIRTAEPVEYPVVVRNMQDDATSDADRRSTPRTPNRRGRSNDNQSNMEAVPSMSTELADLLLWLLEKAPMNRCSWYVF
jgi:serine/threonine protein kinase